MSIGERIRLEREKNGLSQTELARRTDTTQSMISRIEGGHESYYLGTLIRIAKLLGKSMDWLIYGKDPEPPEYEKIREVIESALERVQPKQQQEFSFENILVKHRPDHEEPYISRGFKKFMRDIAGRLEPKLSDDEFTALANIQVNGEREFTAEQYLELLKWYRQEVKRERTITTDQRRGETIKC